MSITREDALSLFYDVVRLSGQYAKSHSSAPACWAGQARCLALLEGSGPISQKRLAEILQIRPTSLSELVAKLERKGLICRAPLPADKRSYRVALTDQGRAEIERVRRAHICADLEFVQAFSDAEVCQLAALMQKAKTFYQQSQKPEGSL